MAKEQKQKITCMYCEKTLVEDNFFKHRNKFISTKYSICKKCAKEILDTDKINENTSDFYRLLRLLDIPAIQSYLDSASSVGRYFSMAGFMKDKFYEDSDIRDSDEVNESIEIDKKEDKNDESELPIKSEDDEKNEKECIRLLGYDHFRDRSAEDRRYLFNSLIGFLDEATLNDGFKLSASIEIVELFNQIDKINRGLNDIMKDPTSMVEHSAVIKQCASAKQNFTTMALGLAKDNGISINNNKNKSNKGAGTLTGIIKDLKEKDLDEAEINLFDIETAKGISQVADISNESIIKQLQFDENDYSEMLIEQKKLIKDFNTRAEKAEENLRKVKVAFNTCKAVLEEHGLNYNIQIESEGEQ